LLGGDDSFDSKEASWEVNTDVPEDNEFSQNGMILRFGPAGFVSVSSVIESKNISAGEIFALSESGEGVWEGLETVCLSLISSSCSESMSSNLSVVVVVRPNESG